MIKYDCRINGEEYFLSESQNYSGLNLTATVCGSCDSICTCSNKDVKFLNEILKG